MANGYALGQLGRAFLTAHTHESAAVRKRADLRARKWAQTIEAMADGDVRIGSRTPVADLPAWVTLEVLRGGFATGSAVAEGPLEADEIALAHRLGVHPDRTLLFGHYLSDDGLEELYGLLDGGTFRVDVPEDAALLCVAWLVRADDRAAALELLDALSPFVARLRFVPRVAPTPTTPPDHVFRLAAGEARTILTTRDEQRRVETQREALTVWNPFADRVLALWWEQFVDGGPNTEPDDEWLTRARAMLHEYERLAATHTRCGKHRKPKQNLAILLGAMRELVESGGLEARRRGLLRTAVTAMVAKRGEPGSAALAAVRDTQRAVATAPAHHRVAAVAGDRLSAADAAEGLPDPTPYAGEVTDEEATASAVPAGTAMPRVVPRVLARTRAASIETLIDDGIVPSSEVLAGLVPRISATVVASTYPDPSLARLLAANYRAFRRRRSLLLLNLEKQVRIGELPWVDAVESHSVDAAAEATTVLRRVGALALDHFPATIVPNQLVQEIDQLAGAAGQDVPLVEELAADIFMNRFSDKFRRAARTAGTVLDGTLYARYYGIDYAQIAALQGPSKARLSLRRFRRRQDRPERTPTFASICLRRAAFDGDAPWSVAANGTVIEQAQVLTTHNLAALVALGVRPTRSWAELADRAFATVEDRLELAGSLERPLATIKDAAYAWRQAVFFLSLAPAAEASAFLERSARERAYVSPGIGEVLGGLRHVLAGGRFDERGECPGGRRFLGWTTQRRHWVLGS